MSIRSTIREWVDSIRIARALRDRGGLEDASASFPKGFKPQFLKFKTVAPKGEERDPDYTLEQIERAIHAESLFRQAKEKYVGLIWKNGYSVVGKDVETVEYVKTRLQQMAIVSGTPMFTFLDTIADQLVTYHNVFIARIRDPRSSGGKPYVDVFGKRRNPVSAYFVLDTPRVKAMVNAETNALVGWKVEAKDDNPEQFYLADDIIHIHMTKQPGRFFGTPMVVPVLNDIRALRKMEEMSEALVFQHAFPLIAYQAGTDEFPVEDDEQFEALKSQVEDSDPQGWFVIPFNHKITAVGNGSNPISVEKYLEYFRQRVISGLGLSAVSLGESGTSNRSTAIVQDRGLQDGAKKYQTVIRGFFDDFILRELLEEGNFDFMDPLQAVHLFTPEIDIDSKIKKEVHAMAGYHGHILTEDEARAEWGRDPFTEEQRANTFWQLIALPTAIINARDESYTGTSTEGGTKPKPPDPELKINRALSVRAQPTNQQGPKRDTKPAVNKASFQDAARRFVGSMRWVFDAEADWSESLKTIPEAALAPLWTMFETGLAEGDATNFARGNQLAGVFAELQQELDVLTADATNTMKEAESADLMCQKLITRLASCMEKAYNLGYFFGKPGCQVKAKGHICPKGGMVSADSMPPHDTACDCRLEE